MKLMFYAKYTLAGIEVMSAIDFSVLHYSVDFQYTGPVKSTWHRKPDIIKQKFLNYEKLGFCKYTSPCINCDFFTLNSSSLDFVTIARFISCCLL
jgi:hypothetical protein